MIDEKTRAGKSNDLRINVNEIYEVRYWMRKFNVTQDTLKEAIKTVGPLVVKVQQHIGK